MRAQPPRHQSLQQPCRNGHFGLSGELLSPVLLEREASPWCHKQCQICREQMGKKKMDPKACICPFRSVALICWRGELAPWPDHLGLLQGKKSPPGFEKPLTVQNFPPALFLRTCNCIITNYRACPNALVLHKDVKCSKISGVLGFNLVNTILSREIISSVCRLR